MHNTFVSYQTVVLQFVALRTVTLLDEHCVKIHHILAMCFGDCYELYACVQETGSV